jgi:ankyrin repeat protein
MNKHYIQNKDLYDKSLFYGVMENSVGTVKYYLDTGAPVNLTFVTKNNNYNGHTLLTLAVSEGRVTIVRELLKRGADIYLRNGQGDSALDCKPKIYAGRINTLLQERKAFKNFLYGEV